MCQDPNYLPRSPQAVALSEPFISALAHQVRNGVFDWLTYYLDHMQPTEEVEANQFEAVSQNLERAHKLHQLVVAHEGDQKKLREILGLCRLEEYFGLRGGKPVTVSLTVDPRIIPAEGEVFVLRRNAQEESVEREEIKSEGSGEEESEEEQES